MSTSTTTPSGIAKDERTYRVERECPASGQYSLRIHRQLITKDADGAVIGEKDLSFAFNEPVSKVMTMSATKDYLKACQAAKTPAALMAAEVAWYDALVAEIRVEQKALADAQKAQDDAQKEADAKAAADA